MRRGDVMTVKRGNYGGEGSFRRLTKRDIDQRIAEIVADVAAAFEDVERERVEYLGEDIYPRLIDNRLFIRVMSRYLVFN